MVVTGKAKAFVRSYAGYVSVLEALGYDPDEDGILARVCSDAAARIKLKRILSDHRGGTLNGERVEAQLVESMDKLRESLGRMIGPEAVRRAPTPPAPVPVGVGGGGVAAALPEIVRALPEQDRDELADLVELDGHRRMVRPRLLGVEQFQAMLRGYAGGQTLARQKLIGHLRDEMLKRGIDMSCQPIEERFRRDPAVRTIPYCVKQIFRSLGNEFHTGLVPIEQMVGDEDADEWLEAVRLKLSFRSQSAMHKAVARQTGLTYDCIHKALSGRRKAKRIQIEVNRCIAQWLRRAEAGEPLGVDEHYLGVCVVRMRELIPRLLPAFGTKEAVYRHLAQSTGLRTGSVRRYFQNDGQLKYAPLSVYRAARSLAERDPAELRRMLSAEAPARPARRAAAARPARRVRPAPSGTSQRAGAMPQRDMTGSIAQATREALSRWRRNPGNEELEMEFKDLRHALIMKVRERHLNQAAAS
jgi:hypothetical protein